MTTRGALKMVAAAVIGMMMVAVIPRVSAILEDGEQLVVLNSYSLHPPYIDAIMDVNRFVRLTQDRQSKAGWLWGKVPFTSASWVIEIEFKVSGAGTSLFGDGFAFWYVSERETAGPVFGSKDYFTGLGVFFDTYSNGRHRFPFPYVTAMVGDGKTTYDLGNDGKTNEIGGCSSDFRGKDYVTKARLHYVKGAALQLDMDVKGNQIYETCFIARNVSLPSFGYLGFSAHTGDATDNHDIIRVSTSGIVNPNAARYSNGGTYNPGNTYTPPKPTSSTWGSIGTAFLILIGIIVLMAVGAGVFIVMQKMKEKSYKRF
ncbi:hypothetical protein HDU97_001495 [Phlyctochytrium planicorne]|nr:hypothetical protein HDU97_001495 [Phlyctochytrium planicorne]